MGDGMQLVFGCGVSFALLLSAYAFARAGFEAQGREPVAVPIRVRPSARRRLRRVA